jgi:hypothetical protein
MFKVPKMCNGKVISGFSFFAQSNLVGQFINLHARLGQHEGRKSGEVPSILQLIDANCRSH